VWTLLCLSVLYANKKAQRIRKQRSLLFFYVYSASVRPLRFILDCPTVNAEIAETQRTSEADPSLPTLNFVRF
jgi:hypothetical protein